jgi:hypothetical protein
MYSNLDKIFLLSKTMQESLTYKIKRKHSPMKLPIFQEK